MLHAALVTMSGFRVREHEMLALGMSLPGLQQRAAAIASLPALGLLTLAALTPDDWSVSYHEASAANDELVEQIAATRPRLVAISALTASIIEAYALAAALRSQGILVVIGGLHATARPEEVMQHADAAVAGDGEPVWGDILRDAAAGRLRPLYRAERPHDLAASPVPRFDLLGSKPRPRHTLQTARGCPLACDFCAASRILGPFRTKPAANIERELAAITALQPRATIELADDNTFAVREPRLDMLDALARSGVRYFTECDWRLGERPEILEHLAASGCLQVLVGIESLMHRHGGMGAKRAPLARITDAVHAVQEAGITVIGCFIVGSDGEDQESMQALGEYLLDAPFADIQLTLQTPFPGSPLFERLERTGRLLPDRDWSSYTLFDVTYRPDRLTVDELERGFRNLIRYTFAESPTRRRGEIRRAIWARRGVMS
jgi:radical SAM superfamily enzyme YgiQ (UPF0313 family)